MEALRVGKQTRPAWRLAIGRGTERVLSCLAGRAVVYDGGGDDETQAALLLAIRGEKTVCTDPVRRLPDTGEDIGRLIKSLRWG